MAERGGSKERWWAVTRSRWGFDQVTAFDRKQDAAGRVTRRKGDSGCPHADLVGPAPDLISAINQQPAAFGYSEDEVVVRLSKEDVGAIRGFVNYQAVPAPAGKALNRILEKLRHFQERTDDE